MTAQKRQLRYGMGFSLLILCLCLFFVINVIVGSVKISLSDIGQILLHHTDGVEGSVIIRDIRLPRILAVIFLGGALSVA